MSKEDLYTELNAMPWLAVTGRVLDWLRDPAGRLPVSCTVAAVGPTWSQTLESFRFTSFALRHGAGVSINLEQVCSAGIPRSPYPLRVEWAGEPQPAPGEVLLRVGDSMARDSTVPPDCLSIEESWDALGRLLPGSPVLVDLSRLRPVGTVNSRGLVASGPETFAQICWAIGSLLSRPSLPGLLRVYSALNGVLRRGGLYKNGAITCWLDYRHPELSDYLDTDPADIPWVKRGLVVDEGVLGSPALERILERVQDGSLWLAKRAYDSQHRRLYPNVCTEILLPDRGTCLLTHLNLGQLTPEEIPDAYRRAMDWLCRLHQVTGVGSDGYYLPPQADRQVGLGLLGLASHLAIHRVRYRELVEALEAVAERRPPTGPGAALAQALWEGIRNAADVARSYGIQRAFTVAPTASSAYRYTDAEGWTTTPEVSPPLSDQIERESEAFGVQFYDHHPRVEVAGRDVDWQTYYRLCCALQSLYCRVGLAHAISLNVWTGVDCDRAWLQDWLNSPLRSTYYRLPVAQNLAKDRILCADQPCSACAE